MIGILPLQYGNTLSISVLQSLPFTGSGVYPCVQTKCFPLSKCTEETLSLHTSSLLSDNPISKSPL